VKDKKRNLPPFFLSGYEKMMKKIKPYMMPIAMTVGAIFYPFFGSLAFLTPCLIFGMLLFTYCKLDLSKIKSSPLHLWLILIQVVGSLGAFLLIKPYNPTLAQGVLICILAPTATAAPVITGMLKGNVATLTAYSLLSNISVALLTPLIFSMIGSYQTLPFLDSFLAISQKVFLLLLGPFFMALLLRKFAPVLNEKMGRYSSFSFYLWTLALTIVTGKTITFITLQTEGNCATEIVIAFAALIICIAQFLLGRKIGRRYNDTVAGGQGLGQKNTILAIWMAQTYLNPIASIGPGAYVLWQNLFNSYQVWKEK
jgi:bile acid:Na+ symporter, BASS family